MTVRSEFKRGFEDGRKVGAVGIGVAIEYFRGRFAPLRHRGWSSDADFLRAHLAYLNGRVKGAVTALLEQVA